jgi:maleamate amidohydrolase
MSGRDAGDLQGDYAKAGFGGSLGFGKRPALIIIDFAMAYLVKESPLYAGVESELESNIRLAAAARETGVPVVWTRVEYQAGANGLDGGYFYRKVKALKCFDAGNPLGEFHPRLSPQAGDLVITKQYPSAFFGTHLAPTLHAMGVDTCVVTGLSTSGCVRATSLDALCHGFIPIVCRDASGDRDARVQEANLFDLQAKYADVISEAQVIDYWRSLGR